MVFEEEKVPAGKKVADDAEKIKPKKQALKRKFVPYQEGEGSTTEENTSNSHNSSASSSQIDEEDSKMISGSIEMTDLKKTDSKEMKEFKPAGLVNHSKKKREKRKAKKEAEQRLAALSEQRDRLTAEIKRKQAFIDAKKIDGDTSKIVTPEGKVLKKKSISKKTEVDEKGQEWHVIDTKKTIVVEESASDDEDSD